MMRGLEYVGFTAAQGIWVQKPMPLDDLMAWDGTWARGNGAIDIAPVAVEPAAKPASPRAPASAAVAHAATVKPQPQPAPVEEKAVSKEDMQRALEAVRARRHAGAAPEAKAAAPVVRKSPTKTQMPTAVDLSELEDVVEDEEASAPPPPPAFGQQKGATSSGEACPPMKTLVERRRAKGDASASAPAPRRASAQDGIA
jgi:hypothetical protein